MPIEIREMQITAIVKEQEEKLPSAKDMKQMKEQIVEECIEQMMQILDGLQER